MHERPSESQVLLHNRHRVFNSFGEFHTKLQTMLKESEVLPECAEIISQLGIMEPLTHRYFPPDQIQIAGPNYRESMQTVGCLSRNGRR